MKLVQDINEFAPISLVLESRGEATVFFGMMDEVTHNTAFTQEHRDMAISISDSLTEKKVVI